MLTDKVAKQIEIISSVTIDSNLKNALVGTPGLSAESFNTPQFNTVSSILPELDTIVFNNNFSILRPAVSNEQTFKLSFEAQFVNLKNKIYFTQNDIGYEQAYDSNLLFLDALSDYNYYTYCYENAIKSESENNLPYYYLTMEKFDELKVQQIFNRGILDYPDVKNENPIFNFLSEEEKSKYIAYNGKRYTELMPFINKLNLSIDNTSDRSVCKLLNKYSSQNPKFGDLYKKLINTFGENTTSKSLIDAMIQAGINQENYQFLYLEFLIYLLNVRIEIFNQVKFVFDNYESINLDEATAGLSAAEKSSLDNLVNRLSTNNPAIKNNLQNKLYKICYSLKQINKQELLSHIIEKSKKTNQNLKEKIIFSSDQDFQQLEYVDTKIINSTVDDDKIFDNLYIYKLLKDYIIYNFSLKFNIEFTSNSTDANLSISNLGISPLIVRRECSEPIEIAAFDDPPIFPDVEFYSNIGEDSKINILLNNNAAGSTNVPTIVERIDEEYYKYVHSQQKLYKYRDLKEREVKFSVDDKLKTFIVYRIDQYPENYSDFSGKEILRIDLEQLNAQSAAVVNQIQNNKNYYYLFRAIDVHGQISDISPIYEVKLVKDDSVIIPIINVIEPKLDTSPLQNVKDVTEKVLIDINTNNMMYNENTGKLGIGDDLVYGKSFMLRLTSKSSGKVVQFKFKIEQQDVTQQVQPPSSTTVDNC